MTKDSPRTSVLRDAELIRRGDAMIAMQEHANGETVLGGQTYQSLTLEVALEAINTIPAATLPAADRIEQLVATNEALEAKLARVVEALGPTTSASRTSLQN